MILHDLLVKSKLFNEMLILLVNYFDIYNAIMILRFAFFLFVNYQSGKLVLLKCSSTLFSTQRCHCHLETVILHGFIFENVIYVLSAFHLNLRTHTNSRTCIKDGSKYQ